MTIWIKNAIILTKKEDYQPIELLINGEQIKLSDQI